MKKQTLAIICILLSLVLVACTFEVDTGNDKTPSNDSVIPGSTSTTPSKEVTIEEQVIYDAGGVRVTAVSLTHDSFWGPAVKVLVENNSDKNITVQARNCSINGLMVEPMFSCDVAAGKKANDTITFMESDLEEAKITLIKDIEFYLHIFDSDSWDEIANSPVIALTTSADPAYVQVFNTGGFVAYENNGVKIIVQKLNSTDSFWGSDVYIYAENNTDSNITIQARDVSINGFMVDPIFSCDIVAGKKAYDTITFFESDLTDNGITDITELEIKFHIFNSDSWDTITDTQAITITFE